MNGKAIKRLRRFQRAIMAVLQESLGEDVARHMSQEIAHFANVCDKGLVRQFGPLADMRKHAGAILTCFFLWLGASAALDAEGSPAMASRIGTGGNCGLAGNGWHASTQQAAFTNPPRDGGGRHNGTADYFMNTADALNQAGPTAGPDVPVSQCTISSINISNDTMYMTWPTEPNGKLYQPEAIVAMGTGQWFSVGAPFLGDGGTKTLEVRMVGNAASYRLKIT